VRTMIQRPRIGSIIVAGNTRCRVFRVHPLGTVDAITIDGARACRITGLAFTGVERMIEEERAVIGEPDRERAANDKHPFPLLAEDGTNLGWLDNGTPGRWGVVRVSVRGIATWEAEEAS